MSNILLGIVSSGLELRDLTLTKEIDVSAVLVLDSPLNVLGACNVLNLDTFAADFVRMNRHVHIDSHLALIDLSIGHLKLLEQLLQLAHDKLGVLRVRELSLCYDLKEWHSCTVVIDQDLVALVDALCGVLQSL